MLALSQGHNDWYRIKNQASGPTQLHIYDEIGFFGITAADLISDLADVEGPVDVHLNSPGGEVNDGLAIYNCLLAREDVTIYVDGIAASIASVIAMAGDKVRIAPTAQIMIHNPFTGVIGDADDLRAMAEKLDENKANIAGIYASRTGLPESHWMKVMTEEGWYRGQEAVDAKLADELIEVRSKGAARPSNAFDMSIYNRGPKNAASHPYHDHRSASHEPMTGMHAHNHAAFGCNDHDDGIHHHPHTHNNDAVHEHGHMQHTHQHDHDSPHEHAHDAGMDRYGAHEHGHTHHAFDPDHDGDDDSRPDDGHGGGDTDHDFYAHAGQAHADQHRIMAAGYDDSAWNGSAAMASCHSAADYNAICAGKRDGDPATQGAHALPHHKHPGSPPNKAGVTAALASLHGSREGVKGLTNRDAAEAHLKAHARAWASGSEDHNTTEMFSEADAAALLGILKG